MALTSTNLSNSLLHLPDEFLAVLFYLTRQRQASLVWEIEAANWNLDLLYQSDNKLDTAAEVVFSVRHVVELHTRVDQGQALAQRRRIFGCE